MFFPQDKAPFSLFLQKNCTLHYPKNPGRYLLFPVPSAKIIKLHTGFRFFATPITSKEEPPMLELKHISYRVSAPEGEMDILKDIDLTIPDEKLVAKLAAD